MDDLGRRPIDGDAPAGINARYEEDYEQMMAELGKLEAVSAGGTVDWALVNDLAVGILKNKSKDLLVASYLAHALYKKGGLKDFAVGLGIICDMMESYFEDMFPPRPKARANALTWLADKTEPLIAALDPALSDYENLERCLEGIGKIQAICDEKMGKKGPALGALKRAVRNWRDHLKSEIGGEEKEAPAPVKQVTEALQALKSVVKSVVKSTVTAVPPVGDLASDQDVKAAVKSVQDVGRKIALHKRQKNPGDPGAYSLLRTVIWMQVERMPPSEEGLTQLPEIDPDRQKLLQSLLDSGSYVDLLNAAETAFCDGMFWLKAHQFAAAALDGLGHDQAKQAVIQSLGAFLGRFPEILDLKFNSGSPFADEMTRLWIEEQVIGGGRGGQSADKSEKSNGWDGALKEALSLAGKGKFQEGLKLTQQGKQGARDGREKFMWQLTCAQYFEKTGHINMAVPQLEHLWGQIIRRDLAEWELLASLAVAKSLKSCYGSKDFKKEMNEERRERVGELKSLIYRLDIDAALMLEAE